MTLWDYLDRRGQRRLERALARPLDARLLANVIGCALISGFLGSLAVLFIIPIPPQNEQIITYMVGQLSGFAGGIVAYHYTLTAGQKELDAKRAESSGKSAEAIKSAVEAVAALAQPVTPSDVDAGAEGAQEAADAAQNVADAKRKD